MALRMMGKTELRIVLKVLMGILPKHSPDLKKETTVTREEFWLIDKSPNS